MDPSGIDPALRELRLGDYRPAPSLRLEAHEVPRARFPVVDAHNHLGRWPEPGRGWAAPDVPALLDLMDACNLRAVVNLDGLWGDELEANLDRYDRAHPGRFATFCHPDWSVLGDPGSGERLAAQLERAAEAGAKGLKVWKDLGLRLRDERGELLMPDDERLADLWEAAADLRLPVLIHVGDPVAFFGPLDATNERLEELLAHPDWWFGDRERFPAFERIIDALESLVARHHRTTFVGAHVGCYAEDLAWVSGMLEAYPNFHVDIAARIAELGRQPRAARRLFLEHPDRIVFGMDLTPDIAEYAIHFRYLETDDEHFAYSTEEVPPQGRWAISGLGLPDDELRNVYADNALRLIPRLAA
ncbi:MAG TPA: amidohydrolase family protein [Actinomycetota bacterium]|nr:amidohydrolase family protein [Actinomycetota bacterium]